MDILMWRSLLLFVCSITAIAAAELPVGALPAKRIVEYPWMSVATWDRLHAEDVLVATHDPVAVLFLGDSITAGWDWNLWQQHFAPLRAANFAIGGDHTGNVLWRLQHGTIGQLQPQLVVIQIGVNNFGHLQEAPEQVAQGVTAVVRQVQLAWPRSRILLQGVLPFEQSAASPRREQVRKLNLQLAKLQDKRAVFFQDYGHLFLAPDGSISSEIMADFLHPTAKGYGIWAGALVPEIERLLRAPGN